jgi:putative ABC transport system substrate-binding protein
MPFIIRRRELIAAALGAAAAWPIAARGQQGAMPVIGFLSSRGLGDSANVLGEFHRGLNDVGVIAGQNAAIEYRWAEGHYERLPGLAADLVGRRVAVIIATGGDPSALAAKAATTTIPIVFSFSDDPVRFGLVTSLNRPGGNATGYNLFVGGELEAKRFDLLHELVPGAALMAMLVDSNYTVSEFAATIVQSAARARGLRLFELRVGSDSEFDAAFAQIAAQGARALFVGDSPFFVSRRDRIVGLAGQYRSPGAFEFREFALAGGLMSYGSRLIDLYHQLGVYAGQVIKGAKPAELPVVRPTTFELVLNLKTAKVLGIDVPPTLLARADEVIE